MECLKHLDLDKIQYRLLADVLPFLDGYEKREKSLEVGDFLILSIYVNLP